MPEVKIIRYKDTSTGETIGTTKQETKGGRGVYSSSRNVPVLSDNGKIIGMTTTTTAKQTQNITIPSESGVFSTGGVSVDFGEGGQGYILSTGEFTQNRAAAQADVKKTQYIQNFINTKNKGSTSNTGVYTLSTGQKTTDYNKVIQDTKPASLDISNTGKIIIKNTPDTVAGVPLSINTPETLQERSAREARTLKYRQRLEQERQSIGFNDFFSVPGQKRRLERTKDVFISSTKAVSPIVSLYGNNLAYSMDKIGLDNTNIKKANKEYKELTSKDVLVNRDLIKNDRAAYALDFVANKPFTTASIGTGVAGVAKSGFTLATTGTLTSATGTAGLTGLSKTGLNIATTGINVAGISGGAQLAGGLTAPANQIKYYGTQQNNFIGNAFKYQESQQGFIQNLAFNLNPAFSNKKNFEAAIKQQYKNEGLTGQELNNAVSAAMRQRGFIAGGEAAGLTYASFKAERIGQENLRLKFGTNDFTKIKAASAGTSIFKSVFNPIGQAGAVEGFSSVLTQQISRQQDTNFKNLGFGTAAGYGSAGVIGGFIAGASGSAKIPGVKNPKGRASTGKLVLYTSYFVDPFEPVGDILASTGQKASDRISKVTTLSPTVFTTTVPTEKTQSNFKTPFEETPLRFGVTTETNTKKSKSVIPPITETPISIPSITTVPVNIPTTTTTTTPTITSTTVPITTTTNIPTITNVPINTNIPITPLTTVPTITPMGRLPPPILPIVPGLDGFFSGGGGARKGKKTAFINELAYSQAVLKEFTLNPFKSSTPPIRTTTKKKSKKKKSKNKINDPFNINFDLPFKIL